MNHEIHEADLQPLEGQTSHTSEVSHMSEVSTEAAIQWLEASKQFAQISVLCAARAGAEFMRLKNSCGRGLWMRVLKQLPVSKDTVYRYIKVADEMEERLLEETGEAIKLLELPEPTELLGEGHAQTLEKINRVTGEQTLRQLYFDWGICRAPKPLGGYHPKAGPPATAEEMEALLRKNANESVGELCCLLQKVCLGEKREIIRVEIPLLRVLEGDLIDSLNQVRNLIKAG